MNKLIVISLLGLTLLGCSHQSLKETERNPAQQKTSAQGYQKYEEAISKAKIQVSKFTSGKEYASALIKLANIRMEARRAGYQCELGYLSDIVEPFVSAMPHSPWLVKNIRSTQVYKNYGKDSLTLRLAANGYYGPQAISMNSLLTIFSSVFKQEEFTLYKAQPGVMSMGQINFDKGFAVNVSNGFNDAGDFEQISSQPLAVKISMSAEGFLTISYNGKPTTSIVFEREGKVIKNSIIPATDSIIFRNIGSEMIQDSIREESIYPDECSA